MTDLKVVSLLQKLEYADTNYELAFCITNGKKREKLVKKWGAKSASALEKLNKV